MISSDQNRELGLINELCRQLAGLGLSVGMSDARPAVMLRNEVLTPPMEITVDTSGEFFEWRKGRERYPVTDPIEAAVQIFARLQASDAEAGDGS